jgi:hypothetical protein
MAIEPAETCAIFNDIWVGGRSSIVTSIQIAYLFARLCSVDLASLLVSDLPDEDEYDDDYVPARCVFPLLVLPEFAQFSSSFFQRMV